MAYIITVRCNGLGKHINDVDIDKVTRPTIVIRGQPKRNLPKRLVIPCQYCTEGKVIITQEMMEKM